MVPVQLHCILRPNSAGVWSIQNDADHASYGMHPKVFVQDATGITIYFDEVYARAGSIQISTDDDFADSISATASLGTQNARITLRAAPHTRGEDPAIDPAKIWDYVKTTGGGNLWINISMMRA